MQAHIFVLKSRDMTVPGCFIAQQVQQRAL
jgi:hypothetical protein